MSSACQQCTERNTLRSVTKPTSIENEQLMLYLIPTFAYQNCIILDPCHRLEQSHKSNLKKNKQLFICQAGTTRSREEKTTMTWGAIRTQ